MVEYHGNVSRKAVCSLVAQVSPVCNLPAGCMTLNAFGVHLRVDGIEEYASLSEYVVRFVEGGSDREAWLLRGELSPK